MSDAENQQVAENTPESETVRGQCALCDDKDVVLKESHSIPKFVYQWLKDTAKTPYIRSSLDVNVRHQDGPKEHLLCGPCEQKLSVLEKELAENFFRKIANYRQQRSVITVTESMRVAVLSIFWRALLTTKKLDNERTIEDDIKLDAFLAKAKADIIAEKCHEKIYLTPFFGTPPYYELPKEASYNLERSIGAQDMRFFDNPHRFFVTFKLPFMYFHIFSDGWPTEEISLSTEFLAGDLNIAQIKSIPNTLRNYINHLHKEFQQSLSKMTKANLEQIRRDAEKNENITGSDKSMKRSS
ncbi:hypothetical protein [Pseudomonas aeruginosa]|uniref:hypothetical protein n=1 Tax=Pseudomonas aeruginosa TaxID=287 RepID=UPI000F52A576|nr:hypothetical protein [Pseudomonas aeruginosa]MDD1807079.1 hypothetical protein [Pseudomonas aeruginosa]